MLKFQPKIGSVVYCDYVGFVAPEMIKKRPVIIISKHRHNSRLVTVVPISTTEPIPLEDYHVEMELPFCSIHLNGERSWVKCDMINVVSLDRLHLVRNKKGIRSAPLISKELLLIVKESVRKAHQL